jgi:hypothetical protein
MSSAREMLPISSPRLEPTERLTSNANWWLPNHSLTRSSCNVGSVIPTVFGCDCAAAIQMPMTTVTIPAARFQRIGSPSNVAPTSEAATGIDGDGDRDAGRRGSRQREGPHVEGQRAAERSEIECAEPLRQAEGFDWRKAAAEHGEDDEDGSTLPAS